MSAIRMSHVMVFAKDLERMAGFYTGLPGLARRNTSDAGYVELVAGEEVVLALHAIPSEIASQIAISSPPKWRGDGALKICFETEDLDASREAILAHGGQAKDPWEWEHKRFCECTDPEGNVLQIFENA